MIIYLKNKHTLKIDEFYFNCSIGKNGVSSNKRREIKEHLKVFLEFKIYILGKIELANQ